MGGRGESERTAPAPASPPSNTRLRARTVRRDDARPPEPRAPDGPPPPTPLPALRPLSLVPFRSLAFPRPPLSLLHRAAHMSVMHAPFDAVRNALDRRDAPILPDEVHGRLGRRRAGREIPRLTRAGPRASSAQKRPPWRRAMPESRGRSNQSACGARRGPSARRAGRERARGGARSAAAHLRAGGRGGAAGARGHAARAGRARAIGRVGLCRG